MPASTPIDDAPFGPDKLYLVTRSFVKFLQEIFAAWETYKWDADPAVSKIQIMQDLPDALTTESKLPAIIVINNGGFWRGPGPSQEMRGSIFRPSKMPRMFSDTVLTSVTIHAIATSDVESSKLAWTIFKAIPLLRIHLQKMAGIGIVEHRLNIGKPTDARTLIPNTPAGLAYTTTVYSPVHIHETTILVGSRHVKNILDRVDVKAKEGTRG